MAKFGAIILIVSLAVAAHASTPAWMENLNNAENQNRAKHGQSPLKLEDGLSNMAQEWADKLISECAKMAHAPDDLRVYKAKTAGENIYTKNWNDPVRANENAEIAAAGAGDKWYNEIADYPWPEFTGQDLKGKMIGHFTQQVWKESKLVGYGLGKSPSCGKIFVVARYWPMGNMRGSYGSNVLPPK